MSQFTLDQEVQSNWIYVEVFDLILCMVTDMDLFAIFYMLTSRLKSSCHTGSSLAYCYHKAFYIICGYCKE
ncbi:hypothetical protein STEG23_019141 [Scotinomys teguina]